jgi:hypothetical protein
MSIIKLVATVSLAVVVLTMVTSIQLPIYATPTTEDDGEFIPDDATPEEKEDIEKQGQKDWEDAGRPGERDDDDDDDDDDDNSDANPYCDKAPDNYQGSCHDRKDYYDGGPNNGLYPCNDGTAKADWRDCKDATKKSNDNDNDGPAKTVVNKPPQLSQPQILSVRTCEQIGTSDGSAFMFNLEIYKICGDSYTDTFISGCEQGYKDLGFVFVRCERVVEANIT